MVGFYFPDGNDEFEYDVRGLMTSFFPGEEPVRLNRRPDAEEALMYDSVLEIPAFPAITDKGERKNATKRAFYRQLSALTGGKELPWGTLTGIRPTKLITSFLEEGVPEYDTASEKGFRSLMKERYLISEEKLDLAVRIAREEQKVLAGIHYENGYSLYCGIPFCPSRCLYCSFTAYPIAAFAGKVEDYLSALFHEMEETAVIMRGKILDTVYIGGGTPTAISAEQLDRVLDKIGETFDLSRLQEFTVEAGRPDSISREKLQVLKKQGVSRISVNPQTMNDKTLELIGRRHSVEETVRAFTLAREEGFDNINMDLILGLPGEGPREMEETIRQIEALQPDSLTVHALAVKRASRLKMEANGAVIPGPGQIDSEEMMRIASEGAGRMGLVPYYLYRQKNMAGNLENVGFTKPGKAGLYNILIMEEKQSIAALGAGTVSKAVHPDGRIERADDVKDLKEYGERIEEMIERKRRLWR